MLAWWRQRRAKPVSSTTAPTVRYFAYGSNMSSARLRERTPSARFVAVGRLPRHALRWHKLGRDGSGKCDVVCTGDQSGDVVWGVVYEIDLVEKADLDRVEGLGVGYGEREVCVATTDGDRPAWTDVAKPDQVDSALRPLPWYKAHVLRGAREHGLPADYIRSIEDVQALA